MRALMLEEFAAWQHHRKSQASGQIPWRDRYLGLTPFDPTKRKPGGFVDICPPILQLGGAGLAARPLFLVSLEPLLDSNNFHRQMHFLSGAEPSDDWSPLAPDVKFDRYESLQIDFWEHFPKLIRGESTGYFSGLHQLISGYLGLPSHAPFAWSTLARHVIEIPLIPMHAPRHRSPGPAATARIAALFERRLLRLTRAHPPEAVICLGADAVRYFLELGAGEEVEVLQGELGHPHGCRFDQGTCRTRLHRLEIGGAVVPLFLRGAPFTTGWQPRGAGTYHLGRLMRERGAAVR